MKIKIEINLRYCVWALYAIAAVWAAWLLARML